MTGPEKEDVEQKHLFLSLSLSLSLSRVSVYVRVCVHARVCTCRRGGKRLRCGSSGAIGFAF